VGWRRSNLSDALSPLLGEAAPVALFLPVAAFDPAAEPEPDLELRCDVKGSGSWSECCALGGGDLILDCLRRALRHSAVAPSGRHSNLVGSGEMRAGGGGQIFG